VDRSRAHPEHATARCALRLEAYRERGGRLGLDAQEVGQGAGLADLVTGLNGDAVGRRIDDKGAGS
jgi:hypothetical protein